MTTQAAISGHEADHAGPNYIAVFIYLSILTAVELGVYAMGLPQVAKVGLLIALAWAKAVLVAMYFMHLAIEKRGTRHHRDHSGNTRHVSMLHAAARSDDAHVDEVRSSKAGDEPGRDGRASGRAAADANAVARTVIHPAT